MPGSKEQIPQIAFVIDDRVTRERVQRLHQLARELRAYATVEIIEGEIPEERLISKWRSEKYALILVPWYRYLNYKKLDGEMGLTRVAGPTVAGYFADSVLPHELMDGCNFQRALLFDFYRMTNTELIRLIASVLFEPARSGLRPLFKPDITIFEEQWHGEQGLAARAQLFTMIARSERLDWKPRTAAIRICLMSLWSLFYEEGPGKSSALRKENTLTQQASFQFAQDPTLFALRLVHTYPGFNSYQAVHEFWPDGTKATTNSQLLLRYSDLLRIHTCPDTHQIEYTIIFTKSAPSVAASNEVHSLWIEGLEKNLFARASDPLAKSLPEFSAVNTENHKATPLEQQLRSKERLLSEATQKIRELVQTLKTREQVIREMKVGGVGTGVQFAPPDVHTLLMALQERYQQAEIEVEELEFQIAELSKKGAGQKDTTKLKTRLDKLILQEQEWIKSITIALAKMKKKRLAG